MSKKEISSRIARWALQLEEYNYKIEHRPSAAMRHVDALSRYTVMMLNNDLLLRVQAAQKKDVTVRAIMESLKHTNFEDYVTERDVLFKLVHDAKLLYVPKAMQQEVIRNAHEQGHFGSKKVEEILARDYFIPKLREKINMVIQNCVKCILAGREGKKEGFLHPIAKESLPLQTYHIDHLGPMTPTKKKYKYILAVVDSFTKFVWLYPTQSTTTEEVLRKLEVQQTVFGNPARIIADRGTAFTSSNFLNYCKEEGIELVHITTGIPRGNGQVERIHKVVTSSLTKLCHETPDDWYRYVPRIQRWINNSVSRSTGSTPFKLLFGTNMKNKDDNILAEVIQNEILKEFEGERDAIKENAAQQIAKMQEENRRQFNKKRKEPTKYQLGDIVAVRRTQFTAGSKLKTKFLGPYRVAAVKGNERYDVEKIGYQEGPIRTSTSADNMRSYVVFNSDDEGDEDEDLEQIEVLTGDRDLPNGDESKESRHLKPDEHTY